MTSLLHPGVYVRELSSGVRVIEGVATSTTIFVGETERGPLTPVKIKGIADYERSFGGYVRDTGALGTPLRPNTMRYSIGGYFANGGTSAYVVRAMADTTVQAASRALTAAGRINAADPGIWANGHLSVVIIQSSNTVPTQARVLVFYQDLRRPSARFSLVEDFDRLSLDAGENNVAEVLQRSAYIRWDSSVPQPASLAAAIDQAVKRPSDVSDAQIITPGYLLQGGVGGGASATPTELNLNILPRLDAIDDAALLVFAPDAWAQSQTATNPPTMPTLSDEVRSYVINRPKLDLFYVADLPGQHALTTTNASTATQSAVGSMTRSDFMGWYWPHLKVDDPIGQGLAPTRLIPPAGTVAGIFARTDRLRGVWKAPAGVEATVGSLVGLDYDLLDGHQDDLNPLGVNVIRPIPGAGTVVWGARTTVPASEWRYVPVRRTAMFLRKSIYNGIQWAVFEPNNQDLWRALRVTIAAFMETQFRNGAFAGASSKDAYFVKCDSETTPESAQLQGMVNVIVGFAPLRPAEFVVVSLTQMTKLAS